jgi:hypothetical protein
VWPSPARRRSPTPSEHRRGIVTTPDLFLGEDQSLRGVLS